MAAATIESPLDKLPMKIRRTLAAYCMERGKPADIAASIGVSVRTVYDHIEFAEKQLGTPIPRRSRRGRPRKAAA